MQTPVIMAKLIKIRWYSVLLALVLSFWSCDKDQVSLREYKSILAKAENGLIKGQKIGPVDAEVRYLPWELMVANEYGIDSISEDIEHRYNGAQYYNLRVKIDEPGNVDITNYRVKPEEFELQERLYYLSFLMGQDIKLICCADTLHPVLYHFEQSYNIADFRSFMVAFEENERYKDCDRTLILDTPALGVGPLKFLFRKQAIKNINTKKILR